LETSEKNSEKLNKKENEYVFFLYLVAFWVIGVFVWFKGWADNDHLPWLQIVFGFPALMFLGISVFFMIHEFSNEKRPKELTWLGLMGLMSGVLVVLFNLGFVVNIALLLIGLFVVGVIAYIWFSETSQEMKGITKYLQFVMTFGFSYGVFYVLLLFFTWLSVDLFDYGNSFLKTLTGIPIDVVALLIYWGMIIGGFITGVFAWYLTNKFTKAVVEKWVLSKCEMIFKKTGTSSLTVPRRYVFLEQVIPKMLAVFSVILTMVVFCLLIHFVVKIPHVGWRVEKMFDSNSSDDDY